MSVNHLFYQQNTHKLYTQLNTVLLTMRICDEKISQVLCTCEAAWRIEVMKAG